MKLIITLLVVLIVLIVSINGFSLTSSSSLLSSSIKYRQSLISLYSTNDKDNASLFASPTSPTPASMSNDNEEGLNVDLDALSAESAAAAFVSKIDLSNIIVNPESRLAPRQAQWFPMLLSPTALDGAMAGDVGFDPLGFSKTKDNLNYMREAEIKHSRLAMLGVVGWSFSELYHQNLAKMFGLDNLLAAEGKAPSILNGGLLNTYIIGTGIIAILIGALLEYLSYVAKTKPDYIPGDLGFDPLKLYGFRGSFGLDRIDIKETPEEKNKKARSDMELSEIKHGRLAMLAITAFAAQEYISGIPVVQQTPFFFGDPIF